MKFNLEKTAQTLRKIDNWFLTGPLTLYLFKWEDIDPSVNPILETANLLEKSEYEIIGRFQAKGKSTEALFQKYLGMSLGTSQNATELSILECRAFLRDQKHLPHY